jgi:hypothetical protein
VSASFHTPRPEDVKAVRASWGLSVREFDQVIGYDTDGRMTMALEAGSRNGRVFEMTGPAIAAMNRLLTIKAVYDMISNQTGPHIDLLRKALPEKMK